MKESGGVGCGAIPAGYPRHPRVPLGPETCYICLSPSLYSRSFQGDIGMPTIRLVDDRQRGTYRLCRAAGCALLAVLSLSALLPAQRIDAPPRLEPTANALTGLQKCGQSIARSAPKISSSLLEAQGLLAHGLLIGWNNSSGEFAAVPPPKQYVAELAQEAEWCLKVAEVLNTEPAGKRPPRMC